VQRNQKRALYAGVIVPWGAIVILLALVVLIALINPAFLSFGNAARLAQAAMVPMVLALGMTFVVIMGSIDLSVEGCVTLAAVSLTLLVLNSNNAHDLGLWAVVVVVLVGALVGFCNGAVHIWLKIPSFMTSLGIWLVSIGMANFIIGGQAVRVMDPAVRILAIGRFGGLPIGFWLALICVFLAFLFQHYSRYGRYIYALGNSEELVPLSGISATKVRMVIFTLAGVFYAIGGLLIVAQMGQGNAQLATGRLFDTITAVVVGGTSLMGGRGGVVHSCIGVLIVTILANGMVLAGVPSSLQMGVQGLMIIVAVGLSVGKHTRALVK